MFQQNKNIDGMSKNQPPIATIDDVLNSLRDITRRLRILEERYTSIRKNIQVNDQNMLKESRKNSTEIKSINMELADSKKTIRSFEEDIKQIIKELKLTVNKDDIKVLERYINIWQPMNYITHQEMESRLKILIKEQFESKGL